MKKIKVTRQFSVENEIFMVGQVAVVEDNFAGSPRYYEVVGSVSKSKSKDKESDNRKDSRQRKRIPDRQIKGQNSAITNKDKK